MSKRYDFAAQRSFAPYPAEKLPKGFRYPEGFFEHSREMLYPLHFRWGFIDSEDEASELEWALRQRGVVWFNLFQIDPIPFARDGEIAAYFDGNDHSGNPPVFIVHLPDSCVMARYKDFDAWLAYAKKQSGIGEPPYDKIESDPSYPSAIEQVDGYYFCPNCYEADKPLHGYDEAIRCQGCGVFFSLT